LPGCTDHRLEPDALRLATRLARQDAAGRAAPAVTRAHGAGVAKLEDRNPTGSVKDRAAFFMVSQAEKDGLFKPGPRCWSRPREHRDLAGHGGEAARLPVICVCGEHLGERKQLLEMYGASIIFSPAAGGPTGGPGRQAVAAENPDWVMLYQYGNEANSLAHYETTGPSSWRICRRSRISSPGWARRDADGTGVTCASTCPGYRSSRPEPRYGELVYGLPTWTRGSCRSSTTSPC